MGSTNAATTRDGSGPMNTLHAMMHPRHTVQIACHDDMLCGTRSQYATAAAAEADTGTTALSTAAAAAASQQVFMSKAGLIPIGMI